MKTIPLTQGKVVIVDDDDFERVSQFKWQAMKCHRTWYAVRTAFDEGRCFHVMMHRQIALVSGIITEEFKVDHIDGDG